MNKTEELFLDELNQLLRMYKVELSVDDQTFHINAWAYTQFDYRGNKISDKIDLDLGSCLNGE